MYVMTSGKDVISFLGRLFDEEDTRGRRIYMMHGIGHRELIEHGGVVWFG